VEIHLDMLVIILDDSGEEETVFVDVGDDSAEVGVKEETLSHASINELIMKGDDIIKLLYTILESLLQLSPPLLDNLIGKIIHNVLSEVKHSLYESIGHHEILTNVGILVELLQLLLNEPGLT
jgi:hypothetical protein